jgi:hypothetical protein
LVDRVGRCLVSQGALYEADAKTLLVVVADLDRARIREHFVDQQFGDLAVVGLWSKVDRFDQCVGPLAGIGLGKAGDRDLATLPLSLTTITRLSANSTPVGLQRSRTGRRIGSGKRRGIEAAASSPAAGSRAS